MSAVTRQLQDSASIISAFVDEWIPNNPEGAKGALAAAIRKAFAAAPHNYYSGSRWVNYGVISSVCRELEGPLNYESPTP